MFKTRTMLFAGALAAGLTTGALAGDNVNEQLKALRAELDAVRASNTQLQGQVAQLRSASDENWLNERRTEEVKALVKEVLADADTRASLLEGGMTAGYNKKFFLASEDGSFLLNLEGQVQFRYIYNTVDGSTPTSDEEQSGFQLRRTKLKFNGHIGSPKVKYAVVLANHRDTAITYLEEAKIAYKFDNGMEIAAGRFKAPFAREELTSSSKQLTVERSVINEFFTTGFSEGVSLGYTTDTWGITGMISDGQNQGEANSAADWNDVDSDFAITARAELALIGKLKTAGDYAAWSKDDTTLVLAGGIHYQTGEGDTTGGFPTADGDDKLIWTMDALFKSNGLGASVAAFGQAGSDDSAATDIPEDIGLVAQVGYMVIPDKLEPFVRWEHFFNDSTAAGEDDFDIVTFGFNWYQAKHASKFTLDFVWVLDEVPARVGMSDSLGLRNTAGEDEDQFVIRAQYQLLF